MAFASILRRSTSSIAPLIGRRLRGNVNYHSAHFKVINPANLSRGPSPRSALVPTLHYSSVTKNPGADEFLIRVINSEITVLQEYDDHDRVESIPSDIPFEIQDNPGLQTLTLKRTYQGEEIEVEVNMPSVVTGDQVYDIDNDEDLERGSQFTLPLSVKVSKKGGPNLEFGCTAFHDDIGIHSLTVKYPEITEDQIAYGGPDFHDLDEKLQEAFRKYLDMRGIKPSAINFLHEYMIKKNSREELAWLKKVRNFVKA